MNTVLFDLDGTLLPLDMESFIKVYFSELAKRFCPILKITPEHLTKSVWQGVKAIQTTDGSKMCSEIFWDTFASLTGADPTQYVEQFDDFYRNEFCNAREQTHTTPYAASCVKILKDKGYRLVAATNPIFPDVATRQRLNWAGVDADDFIYVSTYENSRYCKPDVRYYYEIIEKLNIDPHKSIMIGNDVKEDTPALKTGMGFYLITDCLLTHDLDYSQYRQGSFADFEKFVKALPEAES